MAYIRDFCVARINGFPGNSVGLIHYVANIRTSNHRFHVDSLVVWVAGPVTIKKEECKHAKCEQIRSDMECDGAQAAPPHRIRRRDTDCVEL